MDEFSMKPKAWLKAKPQGRQRFDEEELRRLGQSMKTNGQQSPVVCLADSTIVSGERRWRAAMLTDGLDLVLVRIINDPVSDKQRRVLRVTENFLRVDLTPYEKFLEIQGFRDDEPEMTSREIAELLCLDPSTITRYLSPKSCIEAVQLALKNGAIGIKAVYEISKEADEARQALLLAEAMNGGADGVARQRRKLHSGAVATATRLTRIKCELASGVQVTASGEAINLDEYINALSEALKEAKRARDQGLDAKTFSHVMRDRSRNGS